MQQMPFGPARTAFLFSGRIFPSTATVSTRPNLRGRAGIVKLLTHVNTLQPIKKIIIYAWKVQKLAKAGASAT
jgi:hypothetical protein